MFQPAFGPRVQVVPLIRSTLGADGVGGCGGRGAVSPRFEPVGSLGGGGVGGGGS